MARTALFLTALFLILLVDHSEAGVSFLQLRADGVHSSQAISENAPELGERESVAGDRLSKAECDSDIDQEDLKTGLDIGTQFLVKSQREEGNFRYEYNWMTKAETDEDNPVRQAGTLWALTCLHSDEPKRDLLPAIRKGFKYFEDHSVDYPGGARMVNYPGLDSQKLGTVGLLALSHIEVLRRPELLQSDEKTQLEAHLKGYLQAITEGRSSKHNFYKFYDGKTGKHFGPSSPYYDGECLLALVKAAKYLGHDELWPLIKESAESGWAKNVDQGLQLLRLDELHDGSIKEKLAAQMRMKGYYQWGSMAWYELLGLSDPEFSKYGNRMLQYGDWVVKGGYVDSPDGNAGYAFEGIIPAYVTAIREGDARLEQKFACIIRKGVETLHTLQVGHPKAFNLATATFRKEDDANKAKDERAKGGAQGNRDTPTLRVDTTQHQLHALLMASRLINKQKLI